MKASVVAASGSDETESYMPREVAIISEKIKSRGINVVDVIKALAKRGFTQEAEHLLSLVKLRVSGDYLQTSAIIRNDRVISAINDANDYSGPGTGYRLTEQRREEIINIRDQLNRDAVLHGEKTFQTREAAQISYVKMADATPGSRKDEVVIGISPAFGLRLFRTTANHPLSQVLHELVAGIEAKGLHARIVRFHHTADTSFLGLSAASLSGSGIGIGIQAKGTAVIHHRDRLPHNNLELFSNAPITRLEHYRKFGENAADYALDALPEPVVVPTRGEALGARFHARVALIYAIETSLTQAGKLPEEIEIQFLEAN